MLNALNTSPDHETRLHSRDHRALKLWLRLLTCSNLIEGHIRRELRANFNCTLPSFDLLAQLERVPAGLKMSELSRRLMYQRQCNGLGRPVGGRGLDRS